jgi:hypothetical protein
MGDDQSALRALCACKLGLSEPEIGLEHAFVLFDLAKEARQMAKFARCPFAKLFLSLSFDLVSRPQRPLIHVVV